MPGWRARHRAPGGNAGHTAQALAWQAERLCFLAWAQIPGAMSKAGLREVLLQTYKRIIFAADDPDPELST